MFIKISLNGEAIDFIIRSLKTFGNLGEKIIEKISTSEFKVWGFFPINISEKDIFEFEYGGKFTSRPLEETVSFVINSMTDHNNWVLIDNNSNTNYSVTQNSIGNVTTAFNWNNTVLHLYTKDSLTFESIEKTFKFGGAYPFIGLITKINSDVKQRILKNKALEYDIDNIVEHMSYLFLSAYDEEGYLITEMKNQL